MSNKNVYSTTITVAVNHLNYSNHLGHDSVLTLLQEARMQWLQTINGTGSEVSIEGDVGWLVRQASVDYQSQAFYGDQLQIDMSVVDSTRSSFMLRYHVINQSSNTTLCEATTRMVCFDVKKQKVARIPVVLESHL